MNPPQMQSLCKWPSHDAHFADNRAACHRQSHSLCNSQIGSSMSSAIMQKNAMSTAPLHAPTTTHVNSATRHCCRRYNSKIFAAVFLFTCTHAKPTEIKSAPKVIWTFMPKLIFRISEKCHFGDDGSIGLNHQVDNRGTVELVQPQRVTHIVCESNPMWISRQWKSETKWSLF